MKLPIFSTHEMKYFWYYQKGKFSFYFIRLGGLTFLLSFLNNFARSARLVGIILGVNIVYT